MMMILILQLLKLDNIPNIYKNNDYQKNKNLVDIMRFFTIYTNIYIIEQLTVKKWTTLRCDNLQKWQVVIYITALLYRTPLLSLLFGP